VRTLHYALAHASLALAGLHVCIALALVLTSGVRRDEAPGNASYGGPAVAYTLAKGLGVAALALLAVVLLCYSGRILPWDRHGQLAAQMALWFFGGAGLIERLPLDGPLFLPRVWVLHLGLTLVVLWAAGRHAGPFSALNGRILASPRVAARWHLGAAITLVLGLAVFATLGQAPLGAPAEPVSVALSMLPSDRDELVRAEWYVRWLDWLVRQNLGLARVTLIALAFLCAATWALRGPRAKRALAWAWSVIMVLAGLLTVLPR
jgi:hypothetical protein